MEGRTAIDVAGSIIDYAGGPFSLLAKSDHSLYIRRVRPWAECSSA